MEIEARRDMLSLPRRCGRPPICPTDDFSLDVSEYYDLDMGCGAFEVQAFIGLRLSGDKP